jgi:exportin-2 (importin alpha re-exporter)
MQVTQLFIGYVGSMLQQYGQNPEQNWKAKDCAIYLVMALTVRGKTAAQGATTTNQLVNVMDFFNQHVLPELQSQQLDQRPVLKADSLKYLTTFRSQVPKDTCVQVSVGHCHALPLPCSSIWLACPDS